MAYKSLAQRRAYVKAYRKKNRLRLNAYARKRRSQPHLKTRYSESAKLYRQTPHAKEIARLHRQTPRAKRLKKLREAKYGPRNRDPKYARAHYRKITTLAKIALHLVPPEVLAKHGLKVKHAI